jgi:putative heme iron utilization protein
MAHEPRLLQSLRALLHAHRTAALGTLSLPSPTEAARPFVSFVPYAVDAQTGTLVLHVSGLAAHTRQMLQCPEVSLLICAAEQPGEPVHALERVTITGHAAMLEPQAAASARAAYLARFPEAEPMTELGDFRFVAITPTAARHVAGFGAARDVDADEWRALLSAPA